MKIRKAVVTAAGPKQRTLPLQVLIDRDGIEKSVLAILIEEILRAKVEEICVVVGPGDAEAYGRAVGDHGGRLRFVTQSSPIGYGHALYSANGFVAGEPFLHLVGDHLYVSRNQKGCAQQLVEVAESEGCAVSAVQATREGQLPNFGAIGGQPVQGRQDLFRIETVIEKPTPTEAEQKLAVAGLRAGHYLCFFGMHVLTPSVMELLGQTLASAESQAPLSIALAEAAKRERYLALEVSGRRYDVGVRYGLLTAQLGLALTGADRNEVLARLVELLALRELEAAGR